MHKRKDSEQHSKSQNCVSVKIIHLHMHFGEP